MFQISAKYEVSVGHLPFLSAWLVLMRVNQHQYDKDMLIKQYVKAYHDIPCEFLFLFFSVQEIEGQH